ncbi:MAG TPA: hypothetical protein VF622_00575, partial [Segetibacter sp.]
MKIILFTLTLFIITSVPAQSTFQKKYGTASTQETILAFCATFDSGFAATGTYTDPVNLGSNGKVLFYKFNKRGEVVLHRYFASVGSSGQTGRSISQTKDSGYVILSINSERTNSASTSSIIKLDKNLKVEWVRTFGGNGGTFASSLILTADGGFAFTGFTGFVNEASPNSGVIVGKVSGSGSLEWIKKIGPTASNGFGIVQDNDGGFTITGGFQTSGPSGSPNLTILKLNAEGIVIKAKRSSALGIGYSILKTADNGYIVGGTLEPGNAGYVMLKFNSDLDVQWSKVVQKNEGYSTCYVVPFSEGTYLLVGRDIFNFNSALQFF